MAKDLTDIGLKAGLRTERLDGTVQYVLAARPISDATKDRFDEVIKKRRNSIRFYLTLEDDAGFELCQVTVPWKPSLGDQGKYVALSGKGSILDCPIERYAKSKNWSISFNYPSTSENLSPQTKEDNQLVRGKSNDQPVVQRKSNDQLDALTAEDALTGADAFSGEIETLSGRSFKVTREAEKAELFRWQSTDKISISCSQAACLITDHTNGESVHARSSH